MCGFSSTRSGAQDGVAASAPGLTLDSPMMTAQRKRWEDVEAATGLLERDTELERLVAALRATGDGTGGLVLLEGAAGLGKSTAQRGGLAGGPTGERWAAPVEEEDDPDAMMR